MTKSLEEIDYWFQTEIKKEKVVFYWTITNIDQFLISGKIMRSERYRTDKYMPLEWHLHLKLADDDYLCLWAVNTGEEDFGHISAIDCFILNSEDEKVYSKRMSFTRKSIETYGEYGCRKFISKSELETLSNMYISNNTLKLFVELEMSIYSVHHKPYLKKIPAPSVNSNFKEFLENPLFSDVILSIPGKVKIPAHKAILAAKSPTFFKIFKKEPKMVIYEMTNWTTFDVTRMIEFIYTGTLAEDQDFMNESLMAVAHEFQIWDLKLIIEKNLSTAVSLENAGTLLDFAKKYDASILKARVMHFIKTNIKKLIVKNEFQEIMNSNPQLMSEVFRNVIL